MLKVKAAYMHTAIMFPDLGLTEASLIDDKTKGKLEIFHDVDKNLLVFETKVGRMSTSDTHAKLIVYAKDQPEKTDKKK